MIYKKCVMTIDKNKATLDEDIYLYRLDKNIELYFTIVNNKYRFNKGDMNNIILITNASFFQVRLYKNAEIKYTFAIQPTDGGQAILTITDDLIDDPIEVGDYDFQISLLDEEKTSMISMPIVSKQLHVCEPLVSDDATMGKAILGLSKLATGEIKNAFDSEGNYIREIHQDGDILSASIINKFEEALDTNTKAIKNGTGTPYDDTAIKNDITGIKTDLGTETLNTTAKDIKGAVNEVAAQYKDIAKKKIYQFDCIETMKSYNLKENEVCETLGFYKNSNLGAAKYIIQKKSNQNIDGYSNILLNNGNVASLSNINSVNVYQFGAKGDGITDDTNSIQSALNIAKDVYLQEGIFNITNLTINKYTNLIGCGMEKFDEADKINAEFVFKNYLKCVGTTNDPAIINNGTIKDVNIIGNSNNEYVIKNDCANLINVSIHKGKTALYQLGNHMHIVKNINITWPDLDGIYFKCADSIFNNILIMRCGRDGISGQLSSCSITQGKIEYCYQHCINSSYFTQLNISNMIIDTAVQYLLYNTNVIDKVCFSNCIFIGGNLNNVEAYDSQIYLRNYGGGPMFNACRFIKITAGKKDTDVTNLKYCIDCDLANQPDTFYNCCGYTSDFSDFFKLTRPTFKTSLVGPITKIE